MLDQHRKGEGQTREVIEAIARENGSMEYVNSQPTEYTSDIFEDIKYAERIGLKPQSIHLSRLTDLGDAHGELELNTSYRNSQIAPATSTRESYWSPENVVFHPPFTDNNEDQVMENTLTNISEVYDINKDDPRTSGRLLIENMPPVGDYMIQRPKDIEKLEQKASELGIEQDLNYVFDLGHSIDWREMMAVMPHDRIHEVHFHNKRKTDEGRWENHIPPYEGAFDAGEFLEFYNDKLSHADLVMELRPDVMDEETIERSRNFTYSFLS